MDGEQETSFYEADPIVGKKYKSRRIPDMHGGLPNASATPDQRLDMQGVQQPKSEVVLEKISQQQFDYLHGKNGPSPVLPVLVNLYNNQIEQLKTLKEIRELQDFKIPIGQQRAATIKFATPGFMHLDFTDTGASQTFGIPSGQIFNNPLRKLMKIKIINDGPADILIGSNIPGSDRQAEIRLQKGEFNDDLSFPYPIIWSLNIAIDPTTGGGGGPNNTQVRLFYVF